VYSNDYKERGPYAGGGLDWDVKDGDTNNLPWMQQLNTYMQNQEFFSGCGAYPDDAGPYHYFLSTRAEFVFNVSKGATTVQEVRGSVEGRMIRNPSAFVAIADNQRANFGGNDADKDNYSLQSLFGVGPEFWEAHHRGSMNVLFADGHAARFTEFDPGLMTFRYRKMSAF